MNKQFSATSEDPEEKSSRFAFFFSLFPLPDLSSSELEIFAGHYMDRILVYFAYREHNITFIICWSN